MDTNAESAPPFRRDDARRDCNAGRASILIDGSSYFAALRSALLKARRQIFIVGWDIDSRALIRGETRPSDSAPETLGPLLTYLAERNPKLDIYILLWNYSVVYATEREPLPRLTLDWRTPPGVTVCIDDELPVGASHHEKLVVIDDTVAFCGGLDLTIRRWDTRRHETGDPARTDPAGAAYDPFHDVQALVAGDAAGALGRIARERWAAAFGEPVPDRGSGGDPWPDDRPPDFTDIGVRITRTRAVYRGAAAQTAIEAAYLAEIARAKRLIYIENQYLTAQTIANALRRQLENIPDLELVIVSPRDLGGWLQAHTMGVGRRRFIDRLSSAGDSARVRVFYPWVRDDGNRAMVMVHSKLMIIDDEVLHVGSANLNVRSMRLDTECDMTFQATTSRHRETITRIRRLLIAEHLGISAAELAEREAAGRSVIRVIEESRTERRGLAALEDCDPEDEPWLATLGELVDSEQPLDAERFIGDLFGAGEVRTRLRRTLALGALTICVIGALVAWRYSPLSEWAQPERLAALVEDISTQPWAGPAVVTAFLLGSLVFFPVTVMVLATAIAFRPWSGFTWAYSGCLLAASAGYGIGRLVGRGTLQAFLGRRMQRLAQKLRSGGIVSIVLIRNVPIAPFTLVNLAAGALQVPFSRFVLGTALGMGPGIAAATLLGDRLREIWNQPSAANIGLLAVAVALFFAAVVVLQAVVNRFAER